MSDQKIINMSCPLCGTGELYATISGTHPMGHTAVSTPCKCGLPILYWEEVANVEKERDAANLQNEMLVIERNQSYEEVDALKRRVADVEKKHTVCDEEVAEFSAGFEACRDGISYDDEPSGMKHDQWGVGWAWAAFDGLREKIVEVEKYRDQLKEHAANKHRRIGELENRLMDVELYATLAEKALRTAHEIVDAHGHDVCVPNCEGCQALAEWEKSYKET